jgi:hypothetical protein
LEIGGGRGQVGGLLAYHEHIKRLDGPIMVVKLTYYMNEILYLGSYVQGDVLGIQLPDWFGYSRLKEAK